MIGIAPSLILLGLTGFCLALTVSSVHGCASRAAAEYVSPPLLLLFRAWAMLSVSFSTVHQCGGPPLRVCPSR